MKDDDVRIWLKSLQTDRQIMIWRSGSDEKIW